MFKAIDSGEDLRGKVIKYCNITNHGDGDEHNIICTEDNEVMMYSIDSSGTVICYNERRIKSCICAWRHIENEFINEGIITKEEVDGFREEFEAERNARELEIKKARYQDYLRLKTEFENYKED